MRLVLTLLCRNEADIIRSTVDFHLAQGVDLIIATDNGSIDETPQILREYAKHSQLRLLHQAEHTHDQALWVTHMARLAIEEHGADWLIHCDADEFWWPTDGNLKEHFERLPQNTKALEVSRSNFLPPPLISTPSRMPFYQTQLIRERQSFNALGHPLPGKICHRALHGVSVSDGNHSVFVDGQPLNAFPTNNIKILHYPIRSLSQLERKIRDGAQALMRNTRIAKETGDSWRKLYQKYGEEGTLEMYYKSLILDPYQIAARLAGGSLIHDRRLLDALLRS